MPRGRGKRIIGAGRGSLKRYDSSSSSQPWARNIPSPQTTPPTTPVSTTQGLTQPTPVTAAPVAAPVTAAPVAAPVTAAPDNAATTSPPISTTPGMDHSTGIIRDRSDSATFEGRATSQRILVITDATAEGGFFPTEIGHKVSGAITKIFKEKLVKEGWRWKHIPNAIKGFYWKEFKKRFTWNPSIEGLVRVAWLFKAAERYRDNISKWKKKPRPIFIEETVWDVWHENWKTEDYIQICNQASKNRKAEAGGEGAGLSKHTGGSISFAEHGRRMKEKDMEKREPPKVKVFVHVHTRKGKRDDPSEFIDARSKNVYEKYKKLKEIVLENLQDEQDEDIQLNEELLFIEAAGVSKKIAFMVLVPLRVPHVLQVLHRMQCLKLHNKK